MASTQDIVTAARALVGTPYHHGGRLPGIGIDCIGVPFCAALACGFAATDIKAYPLRPNGMLEAVMNDQMVRVAAAEPGDVLMMAFDGMRPHHLAIYTGSTIIHAHVKARKCIEQAYDEWWKKRTVAVYRYKELA